MVDRNEPIAQRFRMAFDHVQPLLVLGVVTGVAPSGVGCVTRPFYALRFRECHRVYPFVGAGLPVAIGS